MKLQINWIAIFIQFLFEVLTKRVVESSLQSLRPLRREVSARLIESQRKWLKMTYSRCPMHRGSNRTETNSWCLFKDGSLYYWTLSNFSLTESSKYSFPYGGNSTSGNLRYFKSCCVHLCVILDDMLHTALVSRKCTRDMLPFQSSYPSLPGIYFAPFSMG